MSWLYFNLVLSFIHTIVVDGGGMGFFGIY